MAELQRAVATPEDAGKRLDSFLAETFGVTRSAAERLLSEGRVVVEGGDAYLCNGNMIPIKLAGIAFTGETTPQRKETE